MKILSIDTSSEACSASLNIDGEIMTHYELAPQKHSSLILTMCENILAQAQTSLTQLDAVAFGQGPGSFTGLRIAAGVTQGIAFGADLPVIKISTLEALAQQAIAYPFFNRDSKISPVISPISPSTPELQSPLSSLISSSEKTSVDSFDNIKIIAAIDARMREAYWCTYHVTQHGLVLATMDESISSPDNISFENSTDTNSDSKIVIGIGSGWNEFRTEFENKNGAPSKSYIFEQQLASAKEIGILAANKLKLNDTVVAADAIPVYLRNDVAKKSTKKIS